MAEDDTEETGSNGGGKKKKEEKDDPHRQIVPSLTGEAREIFKWLSSLFVVSPRDAAPGKVKTEPDSMPEKIVLCATFGPGGLQRGPEMMPRFWKPTVQAQPSHEKLVELAHEYYAMAKKNATTIRKRQRYCLYAYNNIKGPEAYDTYAFVTNPGPQEYSERDSPATDDEDTHRDRETNDLRAHNRWLVEQMVEMSGGAARLHQEIITDLRDENRKLLSDRREHMIAAEKALSLAEERKQAAEWAAQKRQIIGEAWDAAKTYGPMLFEYFGKGKISIVGKLRAFVEGLGDEVRAAIFGVFDEKGQLVESGILDVEQVRFVISILEGKTDPSRIQEFVAGIRQEQLVAIHERKLLTEGQIETLMKFAKNEQN